MSEWIWKRSIDICCCISSKRRKVFYTIPLYRNQSIDLPRKSMDWFLYDIGLHHERVKLLQASFPDKVSFRSSNYVICDCYRSIILKWFDELLMKCEVVNLAMWNIIMVGWGLRNNLEAIAKCSRTTVIDLLFYLLVYQTEEIVWRNKSRKQALKYVPWNRCS